MVKPVSPPAVALLSSVESISMDMQNLSLSLKRNDGRHENVITQVASLSEKIDEHATLIDVNAVYFTGIIGRLTALENKSVQNEQALSSQQEHVDALSDSNTSLLEAMAVSEQKRQTDVTRTRTIMERTTALEQILYNRFEPLCQQVDMIDARVSGLDERSSMCSTTIENHEHFNPDTSSPRSHVDNIDIDRLAKLVQQLEERFAEFAKATSTRDESIFATIERTKAAATRLARLEISMQECKSDCIKDYTVKIESVCSQNTMLATTLQVVASRLKPVCTSLEQLDKRLVTLETEKLTSEAHCLHDRMNSVEIDLSTIRSEIAVTLGHVEQSSRSLGASSTTVSTARQTTFDEIEPLSAVDVLMATYDNSGRSDIYRFELVGELIDQLSSRPSSLEETTLSARTPLLDELDALSDSPVTHKHALASVQNLDQRVNALQLQHDVYVADNNECRRLFGETTIALGQRLASFESAAISGDQARNDEVKKFGGCLDSLEKEVNILSQSANTLNLKVEILECTTNDNGKRLRVSCVSVDDLREYLAEFVQGVVKQTAELERLATAVAAFEDYQVNSAEGQDAIAVRFDKITNQQKLLTRCYLNLRPEIENLRGKSDVNVTASAAELQESIFNEELDNILIWTECIKEDGTTTTGKKVTLIEAFATLLFHSTCGDRNKVLDLVDLSIPRFHQRVEFPPGLTRPSSDGPVQVTGTVDLKRENDCIWVTSRFRGSRGMLWQFELRLHAFGQWKIISLTRGDRDLRPADYDSHEDIIVSNLLVAVMCGDAISYEIM